MTRVNETSRIVGEGEEQSLELYSSRTSEVFTPSRHPTPPHFPFLWSPESSEGLNPREYFGE